MITIRKEYICSESVLKSLTDEWVKRLHLESWDIETGIVPNDEMDDPGQGEVTYCYSNSQAIIKVCRHEDFKDGPFKQDMEKTLVHELLHLAWNDFEPKNEREYEIFHRALDLAATLMFNLKRGDAA